jgi:hypothetical protein
MQHYILEFFIGFIVAIGGGLNSSAHANSDPIGEWESVKIVYKFSGNATTKKERATDHQSESLIASTPDKAGSVALTCIKNQLFLSTSTEPMGLVEFTQNQPMTRRIIGKTVKLIVNGEAIESKRWNYAPRNKVLMARSEEYARKIYNSAIRGDNVSLKIMHKGEMALQLPKPNKDFANFGAGCGIGRLASN